MMSNTITATTRIAGLTFVTVFDNATFKRAPGYNPDNSGSITGYVPGTGSLVQNWHVNGSITELVYS